MKQLPDEERNRMIKKEKILLELKKNDTPIRFKILELQNLSNLCKRNIISKLDHFYTLDSTDNEYHKLSVWVDCLDKIPFDSVKNLPVSLSNTSEDISKFLSNTRKILDEAVYGHVEAKEKIIQTLTKQISNPNGQGVCIGIQGPMGNGKTTLVKEGICKAVGRPFGFIALGGMQDSSYMLGHDYTYEGAKPGKIVEILIDSNCMNPVIYFDELDKISSCPKGEEIVNFLCHLTDVSQNSEFQDKYLSRVKLDMSKIIYIFSYNDPSKVNPILLDRLFKIKTEGFDSSKKLTISKNYLLPRMYYDFNVNEEIISFTDEAIKLIISKYVAKEEGLRNLKRCLETIISKVNVLRFLYKSSTTKTNKNINQVVNESKLNSNDDLKDNIDNIHSDNNNYSSEKKVENNETKNNIEIVIDNLNISKENDDKISIQSEISDKDLNKSNKSDIKHNSEHIFLDDDMLSLKDILNIDIKNFKIPFVVNENNIDKFLKQENLIDPSISHLYL